MRISEQGQTLSEYAVLMAVVVAALLAMQIYMKRGFSGRLRAAADSVGEQYAPRRTTSGFTLVMSSQTRAKTELLRNQLINPAANERGNVMATTLTITQPDTTTRSGTETVQAFGPDVWQD